MPSMHRLEDTDKNRKLQFFANTYLAIFLKFLWICNVFTINQLFGDITDFI